MTEKTQDTSAFGLRAKTVMYEDYNTDAKISDPDAYFAFLNSDFLTEWDGRYQEAGFYRYRLYKAATGLFIERVWIPALGYSWEERTIFKVLFPREGEE